MDGQFNTKTFSADQDDPGITPENGAGATFHAGNTSATSSPKRRLPDPEPDFPGNVRSRRRAVQKRVVSVPIGDSDGSRMKGEAAPPSDSWAWRKYGQKPIKGSPYPRGYYRCSSWKGCPARKQVERSRVDPTMLVITYACEHNHTWPISKNGSNFSPVEPEPPALSSPVEAEPAENFAADLETDEVLLAADAFCWFSEVASSSSPATETLLESPICEGSDADDSASMVFPMREEDESLFADLGELPECSVVFRRGFCQQGRRCRLREAPCCGSTG